jgi:hypothetical protein
MGRSALVGQLTWREFAAAAALAGPGAQTACRRSNRGMPQPPRPVTCRLHPAAVPGVPMVQVGLATQAVLAASAGAARMPSSPRQRRVEVRLELARHLERVEHQVPVVRRAPVERPNQEE